MLMTKLNFMSKCSKLSKNQGTMREKINKNRLKKDAKEDKKKRKLIAKSTKKRKQTEKKEKMVRSLRKKPKSLALTSVEVQSNLKTKTKRRITKRKAI